MGQKAERGAYVLIRAEARNSDLAKQYKKTSSKINVIQGTIAKDLLDNIDKGVNKKITNPMKVSSMQTIQSQY